MSATPLTDAAISQRRFYETRGEWHGDDVFLYVEPGDARAIEEELTLQILTCKAEIETLRADAERWDYVARHWGTADIKWNDNRSLRSMRLTIEATCHKLSRNADHIEKAIDAAIAKERTS